MLEKLGENEVLRAAVTLTPRRSRSHPVLPSLPFALAPRRHSREIGNRSAAELDISTTACQAGRQS
ncbi:MAG: hypothetical protein LBL94_12410 [Prevotellaceae bacterium]|nr:hypothetical protein [Prevotellaceae bacterium]